MPNKKTVARAKKDEREGKSPSTQAGEFVREEIHHVRQGKHGALSAKQAIAIGLSKARRAGVDLPPPKKGKTSEKMRKIAERAWETGQHKSSQHKPSVKRSRAIHRALEREGKSAASHKSLGRQTHRAAMQRTAADRSAAARKGAKTKGPIVRHRAAEKAAKTRRHTVHSKTRRP